MSTSSITSDTILDEGNWAQFQDAVCAAVSDQALNASFEYDCLRIQRFNEHLTNLISAKSDEGMSVAEVSHEVSRYMRHC
jgi:hypothetical protein